MKYNPHNTTLAANDEWALGDTTGFFTRTVNFTVFTSGTFDRFDVESQCKQHHTHDVIDVVCPV